MYQILNETNETRLASEMSEKEKEGFRFVSFQAFHDSNHGVDRFVVIMHKD